MCVHLWGFTYVNFSWKLGEKKNLLDLGTGIILYGENVIYLHSLINSVYPMYQTNSKRK